MDSRSSESQCSIFSYNRTNGRRRRSATLPSFRKIEYSEIFPTSRVALTYCMAPAAQTLQLHCKLDCLYMGQLRPCVYMKGICFIVIGRKVDSSVLDRINDLI